MIGRCLITVAMLSVILLAAGCSPEEAVYDLEQFERINGYVNEIVPLLEETAFDFDVWGTNLACAERREWLQMDADRIEDVNGRYFNKHFPSYEELETWVVPVSDGEKSWTIKGGRLAPALEQMELSSKELVLLIGAINSIDDEAVLAEKRNKMVSVLNSALDAVEELKVIFRI